MNGNATALRARLSLCEETAADPLRSGCRSPFLSELLRAIATAEAEKIRRELKRRGKGAREAFHPEVHA